MEALAEILAPLGDAGPSRMTTEEVLALKKTLISLKEPTSWSLLVLQQAFSHLAATLTSQMQIDASTVTCSDTLGVWFVRARQFCATGEVLEPEIAVLTRLFLFVSDYLEEGTGPLVNSLQALLSKLIVFVKTSGYDQEAVFRGWIDSAMRLSSTLKTTYFLTESLSRELHSPYVPEKHPDFLKNCICIMWLLALANSVSKAFAAVYYGAISPEAGPSEEEKWLDLWNDAVFQGLRNPSLSKNIRTYLLPALFTIRRGCYGSFVKRNFSSSISDFAAGEAELLLGVLKVGQDLAIVQEPFHGENAILPMNYLLGFLASQDEHLRVSAFSLLTCAPKNTQPVRAYIFDALRDNRVFETIFRDTESVYIRDDFASAIRHFLVRLKTSLTALNRDMGRLQKKEADMVKQRQLLLHIENGKKFASWLVAFLVSSTKPGSSYLQMSLALTVVKTLVELEFDGVERNIARKLAKITPDGFVVTPIFTRDLVVSLLNGTTNNYDDIREESCNMLLSCPGVILEEILMVHERAVIEKALGILHDLKGRKSEGGAKTVQFFANYYDISGKNEKLKALCDLLITRADAGLTVEKVDKTIYWNQRVHGIYTSLRFILNSIYPETFTRDRPFWTRRLTHLIEQISGIWRIVQPALVGAAVESVLLGEMETDEIADEKHNLTYSWKAIKEGTALLSSIMAINLAQEEPLIGSELFLSSVELVVDQLATVKHRGAFASVYPTFVLACEICFRSTDPELAKMPQIWLQKNIALIESQSQYISRRSGGLPYLITGILTAEVSLKRRKNLDNSLMESTFRELRRISSIPHIPDGAQKMDIPQVHAFNCMKHIVMDALLSGESIAYISQVLNTVLLNISSTNWSIRNCAVMLFTALQNRLFGTKKVGSFLPSVSSRLFFAKYPGVDTILYDNLKEALGTSDKMKFEAIFPVLTILFRLECPVGGDKSEKIRQFEPLLKNCLGHKYWKIREMAAQLLASILPENELLESIVQFLAAAQTLKDSNRVHGYLACIAEIITRINGKLPNIEIDEELKDRIYSAAPVHFSSSFNWSTSKVYVDIIQSVETSPLPDSVVSLLGSFLVHKLREGSEKLDGRRQLLLTSISTLLLEHYLDVQQFEELCDLASLALLSTEDYEVQLSAISFLEEYCVEISHHFNCEALLTDLWSVIEDEKCWSYVRSNALGVLQKMVPLSVISIDQTTAVEKVKLLFTFTDEKLYSEDVNSKALEALGSVATRLSPSKETDAFLNDFILLVEKYAAETRPFLVRQSALNAIMAFARLSFKGKVRDRSVAHALFLLYEALSDDDEDIRLGASECLCEVFGIQASVPTSVSFAFDDFWLSCFGAEAQPIVVKATAEVLKTAEHLLAELAAEHQNEEEEVLFEIERLNLYRSSVEVAQNLGSLLLRTGALLKASDATLSSSILLSLVKLGKFLLQVGNDGLLGWSKDDLAFMSVSLVAIIAASYCRIGENEYVSEELKRVRVVFGEKDISPWISGLLESDNLEY